MNVSEYLKLMEDVIAQGPYADTWESLCGYHEPKWYSNAKFGVFIHWGVYAVPAFNNEWYSRNMYICGTPEYGHHLKTYGNHKDFGYKDFIPLFKGERFDADEWMSLIQASGAQYVVPVSEHHDGFQMYDSDLSGYNAALMGPCRDALGELKRAAEAAGLVFALSNHRAENCWFFNGGLEYDSDVTDPLNEPFYGKQQAGVGSDSHNIHSLPPTAEHCRDWQARLVELVEKYQPSLIYFDWWVHNVGFKPYLKQLAAYYYNRAAELGFDAAICYKYHAFPPGAAILNVERGQLGDISPRIWQTETSTARNSWCYTEQNEYKNPVEIVCDLIEAVCKNGRLLLNIGPKADGAIPDEDREILLAVGQWLEQYGEGIYGTSYWEVFGEGPNLKSGGYHSENSIAYTAEDIRFTYKGGVIYAFVMRWPEDDQITIKSLKKSRVLPYCGGDFDVKDVTVPGMDIPVTFRRDRKALKIKIKGDIRTRYPVALKIRID